MSAVGQCTNKGCGRIFSSLSAFDKHQKMNYKDNGRTVICTDPAKLGLVERDGKWGWPQADKPIAYKAVETVEKVYQCRTCGGDFAGSGGRGRPPVTCDRPKCGGKGKAI